MSNNVRMKCGCTFTKKSIARRISDTFSKNRYDYVITCPRNNCGRVWELEDCDNVIKLSQTDEELYIYYLQEIDNRGPSIPTKACPFCDLDCERPTSRNKDDNYGYRVHCPCSSKFQDWCWECNQSWKRNKSWNDCGNSNCYLYDKFNKNKRQYNNNNNNNGHHLHEMDVERDNDDSSYHMVDMIGINNTGNTGNTGNTCKFSVGQKIAARDPSIGSNKFHVAKISDIRNDRVKVKYDSYPDDRYDQWIYNYQYDEYIKIASEPSVIGIKKNNIYNTNNINNTSNTSPFYVGQEITARDPDYPGDKRYHDAIIIKTQNDSITVKYDAWPAAKFHKRITKNEYRTHIKIKVEQASISAASAVAGNGICNVNNGHTNNVSSNTKKNNLKKSGTVGLRNLGNTCFMNSALQCLLQSAEFIELFFENQIQLPRTSGWKGKQIDNKSLAYIWSSFIKEIYSTNKSSIAPYDIKRALNELNSEIGNGTQQDSFMVIETLLQGLEDELCQGNPDRIEHDVQIFDNKDIPNAEEISQLVKQLWRKYVNGSSNDDYSVRQIFDGIECEKTACCACGYQLRTFQTFRQIELPLCNKIISLQIKVYIPDISPLALCTENLKVAYDNTMDGLKYIMLSKLLKKYELKKNMNMKFGYIDLSNNKSKSMNEWITYLNNNDNCSKIKSNSQIFAVIYNSNKANNVKYIPEFNLIRNEHNQFIRRVFGDTEQSNNYGDDIMTFTKIICERNQKVFGKQIILQESKVDKDMERVLNDYKLPILVYNNRVVNSNDIIQLGKNNCLLRVWVHKEFKQPSPTSVSDVIFDEKDEFAIKCALDNSSKRSNSNEFCIDQKVRARDPSYASHKKFYDAKIINVQKNRVKVKYDKWPKDVNDQWIKKSDYDKYIKIISKYSKPCVVGIKKTQMPDEISNSWLEFNMESILDSVGNYLNNLFNGGYESGNNKDRIKEKRKQAQVTHNKLKTLCESGKIANKWLSLRLEDIKEFYEKENINYTKPKMLDDLDDCLALYELNETSNANVLDCPRCAPEFPEIVSRQVDILTTPKILTIHIDREENKDDDYDVINENNCYGSGYYGGSKKRNNLIKYAINGLKFKNDSYDLFGAVEHYGFGTDFGHYVAYVKSSMNKQWYKMNDSSVQRIKNPPISNNVSVLLYKKRN